MPLYELTFISRQELSRQDVQKTTDATVQTIEQGGGKVAKVEYWGLRSLTYKINKSRKGHYTMLSIDAPAPIVKEVERQLRLNEDVIRNLTIRVEALEEGPSVMMQTGRAREEGFTDDVPVGFEPPADAVA